MIQYRPRERAICVDCDFIHPSFDVGVYNVARVMSCVCMCDVMSGVTQEMLHQVFRVSLSTPAQGHTLSLGSADAKAWWICLIVALMHSLWCFSTSPCISHMVSFTSINITHLHLLFTHKWCKDCICDLNKKLPWYPKFPLIGHSYLALRSLYNHNTFIWNLHSHKCSFAHATISQLTWDKTKILKD